MTGRVEVDRGTIVEIPAKFALACLSNCVGVPHEKFSFKKATLPYENSSFNSLVTSLTLEEVTVVL